MLNNKIVCYQFRVFFYDIALQLIQEYFFRTEESITDQETVITLSSLNSTTLAVSIENQTLIILAVCDVDACNK